MEQDRSGRWWPSRTIEHVTFWPVVALVMVGVYFGARWLVDRLVPYDAAITASLKPYLGDHAGAPVLVGMVALFGVLYWIGSRKRH